MKRYVCDFCGKEFYKGMMDGEFNTGLGIQKQVENYNLPGTHSQYTFPYRVSVSFDNDSYRGNDVNPAKDVCINCLHSEIFKRIK